MKTYPNRLVPITNVFLLPQQSGESTPGPSGESQGKGELALVMFFRQSITDAHVLYS